MFCYKCGREAAENALFCSACGAELAVAAPPAPKRNLSLAAGIVEVTFGCLGLLSALFLAMVLFNILLNERDLPRMLLVVPLALVIPAALAIIGGIFAIKKRNWPMALVGAIALLLSSSVAGVAALVLVILGRDEFTDRPPSP